MMIHELKIWPKYFDAVNKEVKRFEIRKNDRNFQVGELLLLKEFDSISDSYSGRQIKCKILYILEDPKFIKDGFVVMSIKTCGKSELEIKEGL